MHILLYQFCYMLECGLSSLYYLALSFRMCSTPLPPAARQYSGAPTGCCRGTASTVRQPISLGLGFEDHCGVSLWSHCLWRLLGPFYLSVCTKWGINKTITFTVFVCFPHIYIFILTLPRIHYIFGGKHTHQHALTYRCVLCSVFINIYAEKNMYKCV